jgi:Fe-S-cluster containining protein
MKNGKVFPVPVRAKYSCSKCPAYCCSYPEIEVTPRDIERLARYFGIEYKDAEQRFTKVDPAEKVRLLRHRQDRIFDSVCMHLDQQTRRCTVYEARPAACRQYPDSQRCGYYDFLTFERAHQDDPKFIALT